MGFEVAGLVRAEVDQSFAAAGGRCQTAAELLGTAGLGRTAAVAVLLSAGTQKSAQKRTETVVAGQIVAVIVQIESFGIEEVSAVAAAIEAAVV